MSKEYLSCAAGEGTQEYLRFLAWLDEGHRNGAIESMWKAWQAALQAAANKAAEEGGLPESDFQWRKKPVVIEAIQWPGCRFPETPPQWFIDAMHKTPGKPGFLMRMDDNIFIETLEGRMRAEPGDWIIRGIAGEIYPCKPEIFEASYERASRQVANKAEVDLSSLFRSDWSELGMLPASEGTYVDFYHVEALLAPPPATTGASTCTTCDGSGMVHRADGEYMGECSCVLGSVGASTILTDERTAALIEARDAVGEFRKNLDSFSESKQDAALAALDGALHAIDALIDEVAAQAGQVAVIGLSEEQTDRIARNYFSEQWAVQHAKDAIHDALIEASAVGEAAVPEGFAIVPVKPTPKMVDATFNHSQEKFGSVESHNTRNKRIYAAMIAAAPSPAKESK